MKRLFTLLMSLVTMISSWLGIGVKKPEPDPVEPPTSIVETTAPTTGPITEPTKRFDVSPLIDHDPNTLPDHMPEEKKSFTNSAYFYRTTWNITEENWVTHESKKTTNYNKNRHVPDEYETDAYDIINYFRIVNNKQPIKFAYWWYDLVKTRSDEILTQLSHTRPDGSLFFTIFDDENIPCVRITEGFARGHVTGSGLVDNLYKSDEYRDRMLNESYEYVVIAHSTDEIGQEYCVLIFLDMPEYY